MTIGRTLGLALCVLLTNALGCTPEKDGAETDTDADTDTDISGSAGCDNPPTHATGGVNVLLDAGGEGDGERRFFLTLPEGYDPSQPHRLVLGYPGTNWRGEDIRPYLDLEGDARSDEIFVYPDPLWRDFEGWGNYGGWVLGPHASPAHGDGDLVFTSKLLDYMESHYCIDTNRVFVTGHSWGGDMAQVVSCFLGDRIAGSVPVAANRPYWFYDEDAWIDCEGKTAVWTFFGVADDHFSSQAYPGEYGDACRDFWLDERGCDGESAFIDLAIGEENECVEFSGCSATTRYCLYGPATGHQVPSYYSEQTMAFFRSL